MNLSDGGREIGAVWGDLRLELSPILGSVSDISGARADVREGARNQTSDPAVNVSEVPEADS
jgi:hypothetical protein